MVRKSQVALAVLARASIESDELNLALRAWGASGAPQYNTYDMGKYFWWSPHLIYNHDTSRTTQEKRDVSDQQPQHHSSMWTAATFVLSLLLSAS
jgi:hypothetical protein